MELTSEMIADVVLNIINILVLFFVVRALAYKPVKKFMASRTERVNALRAEAQSKAEAAESKAAECEAVIADSKKAKEDAVKAGEAEARKEAERIVNAANEKAAVILETADAKAKAEHDKMISDARDEVVSLALDISSKLLSREVSDEDNKRIVESFIGKENG